MAQMYNVVAKCGTYKDNDGKKVQKWAKVGVSVETRDGGIALKIDTLPVEWDGWLQLAVPNDNQYNY